MCASVKVVGREKVAGFLTSLERVTVMRILL